MKEIELTKGYTAKVDDDDYDWLMGYSWHAQECGHAEGDRRRLRNRVEARTAYRIELPDGDFAFKPTTMHRLIMKVKPRQQVDHINGDPLDNRRLNLRFVTNQQNAWNARGARSFNGKPTTSRFKGVFKKICKYKGEPRYEYYVARAKINGKDITIYHGKDEIEAACRYDHFVQRHHGEYARLNFDGAAYDKWYNDNHAGDKPSPLVAAF